MARLHAAQMPKVRERYAVILLMEEAAASVALAKVAPPDLGVPVSWVPCGVHRALVLRYVAGDGQNLPQAAKVQATLAAWPKAQGWGSVRPAVLASPDPAEMLRLLRAWDARRGAVGEAITLSYPLALPDVAGDDSAERPVPLAECLEHLGGVLLPWYNARLNVCSCRQERWIKSGRPCADHGAPKNPGAPRLSGPPCRPTQRSGGGSRRTRCPRRCRPAPGLPVSAVTAVQGALVHVTRAPLHP